MRAASSLLTVLTTFGLVACAGGPSVTPPDDDPALQRRFSTAVVGYPGSDAVVLVGRSAQTGDVLGVGVLHGFDARLDLELLDPSDVPGNVLVAPGYGTCDATVTPDNLRLAEVVDLRNVDAGLVVQLRNRPPDAEIVGTEVYAFMLANVAGAISATCAIGTIEAAFDLDLAPGWNVVAQRVTDYEQGVLERAETFTLDTLPAEATWYALP